MAKLDRRAATILAWLLTVAWAAGQLLAGRTWVGNLLFHLPTPGVAAVIVALAWLRDGFRIPHRGTAALALLPLGVLGTNWRLAAAPTDDAVSTHLTVVHWNAGRGQIYRGWERGAPMLAALHPDLLALSEAPRGQTLQQLCDRLGPDYSAVRRLGLAFLGRGDLEPRQTYAKDDLQAWAVRWTPPGREPLLVLMIDLPSDPLIPRDPGLRRTIRLIEELAPDLVVGDFNAPRQSWALRHLPSGWRHCHDEAGSGLGLTWPVPVPMFAIDQCIVGPRLQVADHRLGTTWASDHRVQRIRVLPR